MTHGRALLLTAILLLITPALSGARQINSASELDYPPFAIVTENDQADGFSVELMKAAVAAMGSTVSFKVAPWHEIKAELVQNRLDALPLVGRSTEREKVFDFTFPYISLYGAVFTNSNGKPVSSLADLKALKVAVLKSDNAEEYVKREKLTDNLVSKNSYQEAFLQLEKGEVDAVVAQRLVGLNLIKDLNLQNIDVTLSPLKGFKQDFCFAVTKGDSTTLALLNEGLSIIMANGEYTKIRNKWLSILDEQQSATIDYLKFLLGVFLGAFVIVVIIFLIIHFNQHKKLKILDRAKSEFIANMSHELRTPMHAISSFAVIGQKKCMDEKACEYFQKIQTSAKRLTMLLNDLLDLSKLEAGKVEADLQQHDIMSTIRQVIDEISQLRDIQLIKVHPDPLSSIKAVFDEKLIYRVLLNILSNAIKFSPQNSEIHISVTKQDNDKRLSVSIDDLGVGIPDQELNNVFDKFIQSSKTKNHTKGGTGLGLSICKEIMLIHHGHIWAESPPPGRQTGTRITLQLPLG